jgi:penicillin amidase
VRPFAYLLTRNKPVPWRSEDTLLAIVALAFTLNDAENARELAFTRMRAALPESAFRFLTASGGSWDAPLDGPPLDWPEPPTAAELDLRTIDPNLLRRTADTRIAASQRETTITADHVPGSNSIAVAGALSGGAALIANDTHLDLSVPCLWFRARLIYPNSRHPGTLVDVSGVSLPGLPGIVIGSNGHIAWGLTNSYIDTADWVRVIRDPADPDRYRSAKGWIPIAKHTEVIHVHGAADQTLTIEDTQWGPILAHDTDGTPLALAWTAQQPGAVNLELLHLDQAENTAEAAAIAQTSGIPPQNMVVGDRSGSVEWTIAGRIPRRIGDYDPTLPADWSKPGTGWDGWLDPNDVPLIDNPPWQRLWTANQRTVQGTALALLGNGGYDIGARARQIRDDLRMRSHFAPNDMLAIQLDDRAIFLERWKDLLVLELDRTTASPLNAAMKRTLAGWTDHASIDSVAYRLVRAWRNEVINTVLDAFAAKVRAKFAHFALPKLLQAEQAVWKLISERPMHLLPPGYGDWDALLIASAERAGKNLDAQPGGLAARTWGEHNTTRIAHPLSHGLPGFVAHFLDMPAQELPGDINMPRVQEPTFGAVERFAVAPSDEAHGYLMIAGGQSGHPLSPYYGAGHADWATGKPTPFLPGRAQHRLMFVPVPG